jgi:hypothetical protein
MLEIFFLKTGLDLIEGLAAGDDLAVIRGEGNPLIFKRPY